MVKVTTVISMIPDATQMNIAKTKLFTVVVIWCLFSISGSGDVVLLSGSDFEDSSNCIVLNNPTTTKADPPTHKVIEIHLIGVQVGNG